MRMYRIKELNTDKFFNGFRIKRGEWFPSYSKEGLYFTTFQLNYHTKMAVDYSVKNFFDKIEVVAYNLETVNAGSMTAEKLKIKHEKSLIVKKLKA